MRDAILVAGKAVLARARAEVDLLATLAPSPRWLLPVAAEAGVTQESFTENDTAMIFASLVVGVREGYTTLNDELVREGRVAGDKREVVWFDSIIGDPQGNAELRFLYHFTAHPTQDASEADELITAAFDLIAGTATPDEFVMIRRLSDGPALGLPFLCSSALGDDKNQYLMAGDVAAALRDRGEDLVLGKRLLRHPGYSASEYKSILKKIHEFRVEAIMRNPPPLPSSGTGEKYEFDSSNPYAELV